MCDYSKYVYNKYIRKSLLVECGKCPACQQRKANARALRIRNHNDGKLCLFVTCTYDNMFVPYVITSDLLEFDVRKNKEIKLYRDYTVRFYKDNKIVKPKLQVLETFHRSDFKDYCYDIPHLKKKSGCCGLVYWPDVQCFIKRLRINLKRYLGYDYPISYYAVGEYGSKKKSWRPHFHVLIYFEKGTFEEIRPVIIKSWPYGDMQRKRERIQVAIDASGYVASYVNKSVDLPEILSSDVVRQKSSHSLFFGHSLQCFSLPSLLEKADRHDMSYSREILKDGVSMLVNLPIPKYIINRFFPKFKGYCNFAPDEVLQLLRFPVTLWNRLGYLSDSSCFLPYDNLYSRDDYKKFIVHLRGCIDDYIRITGRTIYDYSIDYQRVWFERFSFIFRHSYDDIGDLYSFLDFYENAGDYVFNPDIAPTLPDPRTYFYELDPNKRKSVIKSCSNLTDLFWKKERLKEINSIVLADNDEEFQ